MWKFNPIVIFIRSILSKWYIIVVLPSIMVAYWGLKGLNDAGVLHSTETIVVRALTDAKGIAQHCTPKIANLRAFWHCIEHVDKYVEHEQEKKLKEEMWKDRSVTHPDIQEHDNPYEPNPRNPYNTETGNERTHPKVTVHLH